jgi:hypothetical protein
MNKDHKPWSRMYQDPNMVEVNMATNQTASGTSGNCYVLTTSCKALVHSLIQLPPEL